MRPRYYVLVKGKPAPAAHMQWARMFEDVKSRIIASTYVDDLMHVSTVFLGLDHNFALSGPPILFETMVFGGPKGQEVQYRYATMREAKLGHSETVKAMVLVSKRCGGAGRISDKEPTKYTVARRKRLERLRRRLDGLRVQQAEREKAKRRARQR